MAQSQLPMDVGLLIAILGALVVFSNVLATARVWQSAMFDTGQKVAQTILLWLIPGSVLVVWHLTRVPRSAPTGTSAGSTRRTADELIQEVVARYGNDPGRQ